jgi:tetratricopeptide (TPR) repeat protein
MSAATHLLSATARKAAQSGDWARVAACAGEILGQDGRSAEGHFLGGLAEKAARRTNRATAAFATALELDAGRYDAAIELALLLGLTHRGAQAFDLLAAYESRLGNSPRYLDLAGLAYSALGLHERAWPLHRRANELQPGVPVFEANLAACSVYVGRIDEARALYRALLARTPSHQRNHYALSRLEQARDASHIEQMKAVLASTKLPPDKNIFLYYAIGKEFEDLARWEEAFQYYKMAGDAATAVANYDVAIDVGLIDALIDTCSPAWISSGPRGTPAGSAEKTPIFIVGLPRTGTTLVERILSSHSKVESIGETLQLQETLRRVSGIDGAETMTAQVIAAAATQDNGLVAQGYFDAVRYRFGDRPMFIEKFPENFLFAGFIAKAWPDARLVYLRRNPMDTCFAMYKQSYFRYAYTLENLGRYYIAHARLLQHWRSALGDRLIEVGYETLVAEPEKETRRLLERLGLEFEPACLQFESNPAASATASSVQVREKVHDRSVNRWRQFERELAPLRQTLEHAGIAIQ